MNTDPIADFLTRIRNAIRAGKTSVSIPHSTVKENMARILEEEGIVEKSRIDRTGKFAEIRITLNENANSNTFKRISKPGQRIYKKADEIRPVQSGYGISIWSTSQGLLTGEKAKAAGIGGEFLCEIY